MFDPQDILRYANRELLLSSATPEEQITYIEDQIRKPFDTSTTNYFKKLSQMVQDPDEMDEICAKFFTQIQDVYPHLTIDVSEYEKHLESLFEAIYKFFVKNASKLMYLFIKEFIFNNKNRKVLTDQFNTAKLATYPKEQYGKKEFYILVVKLGAIIDEIFSDDDITLLDFIDYVDRNAESPVFIQRVRDAVQGGYIIDNGVISDMYKKFKKSESFRGKMNKLEMDINYALILPYLEETGLIDVRLPEPEELPEEISDDDDEDEDE